MVENVSVKPRYLGDGVYASYDGYYVHLHVGAHDNPPVVALEPQVLACLDEYVRAIREANNV